MQHDSPRERLQDALATNGALEFLKQFKIRIQTVEHAPHQLEDFTHRLFLDCHKAMFQHMRGHPSDSAPAGWAHDPIKRDRLREITRQFSRKFFDESSGNIAPIPREEMIQLMAHTYHELRALEAFKYGNRETLNLFMHCLTQIPGFEERYTGIIDFRRLTADEAKILDNAVTDEAQIVGAFDTALTSTRKVHVKDKPTGHFVRWGNKSVYIGNVPFLGYRDDDVDYLVTVNGGLVRQDAVQKELIAFLHGKTKHIAEFSVKPERYLDINVSEKPGHTKWLKDNKVVDGYEIGADGSSPLLCLDANPLTGLRSTSHDRFMEIVNLRCGGILFELANSKTEQKVLEGESSEEVRKLITIASSHIREITHQLDHAKHALIQGKYPHEKPHLFISMGGPGSGKNLVEEKIAPAYCADDFVVASLDASRNVSNIFKVLQKCGHNHDDYTTVEPLASEMRNWIANGAIENHFNLLYDGTGIPFVPRYSDNVAKRCKDAGYHTMVCMVDSMLLTPEGREEEYPTGVIERIRNRASSGKDVRALPWSITVKKHKAAAQAVLDACDSPHVDKLVVYSNDGPYEKQSEYLMAETFDIPPEELTKLTDQMRAKQLKPAVMEYFKSDESISSKLAKASGKNPEQELNRQLEQIPAFEESNIAVLARPIKTKSKAGETRRDRIFVLPNVTRAVDLIQKAAINSLATGPEELLLSNSTLAFKVRREGDNGHVPMQQPSSEYTQAVVNSYQKAPDRPR